MKSTNIKEPYFSRDIVLFAVGQRTLGRRWKDIRREIGELYKIEPPCERQMLLWFNQWGPQAKSIDSEMPLPAIKARLKHLRGTYRTCPATALTTGRH